MSIRIPNNGIENRGWFKKGVYNGFGFQKGQISSRKGVKLSEETKKKMSLSKKGKHASPKTEFKKGIYVGFGFKKGMISLNKGKKGIFKHSEEYKRKLSERMKGNNYRKGKKDTDATKKRKRDAKEGNKNPNWKDGITPENLKIRHSLETRLWHKACFERDNFTCQKYGTSGGKLQVHHINNFADFPELRFSIDNGITLSERAHREFHHIYGRKNNTQEQLDEFLNNDRI